MGSKICSLFILLTLLCSGCTRSIERLESNASPINPAQKPFRTFVTIQRYNMENNGDASNPISNIKLEILLPNGQSLVLPEGNQYWPIGNGQVQEINRSFEIPWSHMQGKDGFKFHVQMVRKGSPMLPCKFDVVQIFEFNRVYVCRTNIEWQLKKKIPQEQLDKEGIQVRVFTDLNSLTNEIPNDAIALR